MTTQHKTNTFQYLTSIDKAHSNLWKKMGVLFLTRHRDSFTFSMGILIVEYLQLMSQALLINPALYDDSSLNPIYKPVIGIAKFINPGFWIFGDDYYILTLVLSLAFILFTGLKSLVALYVVTVIESNLNSGHKLLFQLWELTFNIQSKVLCFFIASFWVKAVTLASQSGYNILGLDNAIIITVSIVMIACEYILSFVILHKYFYVLPAKNFLSAKDNYLDLISLTQKLTIQILQMTTSVDTTGIMWIITSLNLFCSVLRRRHYYSSFPFYRREALHYQRRLLIIILTLNLACFTQKVLESLDYDSKMDFIITTWIILYVLASRFSDQRFNEIEFDLISSKRQISSVKLLLHKISVMRHLIKFNKSATKDCQKYDFSLLVSQSLPANLEKVLNINSNNNDNSESDKSEKEVLMQYLEQLQTEYPKDEFLNLYIAYFYAKKLRRHGIAIKTILTLKKSSTAKIAFAADFLISDIETQVEKDYVKRDNYLDTLTYLKSRSHTAQMKEKILKQIEMQKKLYYEVLNEAPDLEKISQYSQKIKSYKTDIEKRINALLSTIPESYIGPLMISALYHFSLSHSVSDYQRYSKKYSQMQQKYRKFFQNDNLMPENLYQEETVFLVLSGDKNDSGKILFSTKNIEQLYGGEIQHYIGAHVGVLCPSSFQNSYNTLLEQFAVTGNCSFFRVSNRGFGFHKEGYLIEADCYLDIHPFMATGFYFDCLLRPVRKTKECILFHPNGNLEAATEKIAKRLGLLRYPRSVSNDSVNIKMLSKELGAIIDAYSIVEAFENGRLQKEDDNWKVELTKSQELCSAFSSKGKILELTSLLQDRDAPRKTYKYYCVMADQDYRGTLVRVIRLEAVKDNDENNDDDEESVIDEGLLEMNIKKAEGSIDSEDRSKSAQVAKEIEGEFSDLIEVDEKREGWIDFQALESQYTQNTQRPLLINTDRESRNPEENKDETLLPAAPVLTQEVRLVARRKTIKSSAKVLKVLDVESRSTKNEDKEIGIKEEEIGQHFRVKRSIASSQRSKNSQEKKISAAYNMALAARHSSTTFKIISAIFYLLFIAVLVSQLVAKLILDSTITNLKAGKDTIVYAETRSLALVNVINPVRYLSDVAAGKVVPTYSYLADYTLNWQEKLVDLANVNQKLMQSIDTLDETNRASLFQNDVRIFKSYADRALGNFINLTNFQATDRIVETGLRTVQVLLNDPPAEAQDDLAYITENTVNDLLVKNDAVSDAFLSYFENEQRKIDQFVLQVIAVTVALLGFTSIIFTVMIWKTYTKEKYNLVAVTKLQSQGIWNALDRINNFKRIILGEISGENDHNAEAQAREGKRKLQEKKVQKEYSKDEKSIGIRKRYFIHILKLWFLILLLVGVAVANSLTEKSSVAFLQSRQSQLYFINKIKSQAALIVATGTDLFVSNGTSFFRNEPSATLSPIAISELTTMRDLLSDVFMKKDLTYDPEIQDILFLSPCQNFESELQTACLALEATGKQTSLVYVITDYVALTTHRFNQYQASDKTVQNLYGIMFATLSPIVNDYYLVYSYCEAISEIVNEQFENKLISAQTLRNVGLICLYVLVIVIGGLMWFYVLRKVRDADHQFKIVLQAFPPNVVLASFILRTFLIKTSKGALDFVKNEI